MHRILLLLLCLAFCVPAVAKSLPRQELDRIQQLIYDNKYAEAQSSIYAAFQKNPDRNQLTWLNILLSDVKRILGPKGEGMKYARTALSITYTDPDRGNINRSLAYHKIANIFYEEKAYDSAYVYATKSIEAAERYMGPNNRKAMRTMNLSIIGYYYLENNQFAKAEAAFLETNKLHEETGGLCEVPLQLLKLADLELKRKNLRKAEEYASEARKIAIGCHINVYTFSAISKLIDIYRLQGNSEGLYKAFAQRDSLSADDNTQRQKDEVAALEVKYKAEIRDQENKTLRLSNQRERERNWVVSLGFVIVTFMLIMAFFTVLKLRRQNRLIAEQKAELERLNVLNRKIFSVISHDFRGPLQNLSGALDLTESHLLDAESFSQLSHAIKLQMGQAQQIMENLISWAKAEMNLEESTFHFAFVQAVAEEITEQFEKQASAKKLTINIDIPETAEVKLPPDALRIVYRNILGNAIKYSFENGRIDIGFNSANDYYFVRDTGTGASDELLKKLFLNRVSSVGGTKAETGYGLGLHLVNELVRKHGGTIWAEHNPGGGVVVCFRLPK